MKNLLLAVILIFLSLTIGFLSCQKDTPPNLVNLFPVANAGPDLIIVLPKDSVILDGTASQDPDGHINSYEWKKISGPTTCTIINPAAAQTKVKDLVLGIYEFELSVTDNEGLKGRDTTQVQVTDQSIPLTDCDISSRLTINASLTQIGTLSKARFPYVGIADNKIVFAGGAYYTGPGWFWVLSNVDIYDVITKVWTAAQLSLEREGIATASCGNKIFFAGGGTFSCVNGNGLLDIAYDNIDIYDASINAWSVSHLTIPRTYLAAAAVGNKIFFAGGIGNNYVISNRIDIYDLSTNSWSIASLSEARAGLSAVVAGDKIYFAGGYNGTGPSSKIDVYNASTNSWSTSILQELSGDVSGVAKDDRVFWAGQVTNHNTSIGKVEIWNTTDGSITTHCLSYSRFAPVAVVRNNEVAFFMDNGWGNDFATVSNRFDIYNIQTSQWSIGLLPLSVASAAIINANNTIYVGGGKVSTYNCTDKVYMLSW